jgi:hypothetical protein
MLMRVGSDPTEKCFASVFNATSMVSSTNRNPQAIGNRATIKSQAALLLCIMIRMEGRGLEFRFPSSSNHNQPLPKNQSASV